MSGKIDNLTITNHKSDAAYADCIVRYVDGEGNELKKQRADNAQVGSYIKLLDSDKESFFKDGQKYIYLEDNSATTAIASDGSTIITVTFRKAEKYNAVLNCMVEGGSGAANQLAEFNDPDKYWFFEGEQFNIYTSLGYKHTNGKYYFAKPNSNYHGVWFTFPGDLTPETNAGKTYYIGRINYSLDESVAYYSDFERLALPVEDAGNGTGLGQLYGTVNSWYSFTGDYFNRFSGARSIRLDSDSYVWTEPIAETGNYRVVIYGRNDKSSLVDKPYKLGLRDSDGNVTILNDLTIPAWEAAFTCQSVVENVSIPAGYSLVIMNEGTGDHISLDDITLFKTDGGGEKKVYTEFVEATGTLTYYYDDKMSSRSGITEVYDPVGNPDAVRFKGYGYNVLKAVIDPSMKDAPLTSMKSMFYGMNSDLSHNLYQMTAIEGLEYLNTENVVDMSYMFFNCSILTSFELSNFNTANVKDMNSMFFGCRSLTSLDISNFNTSNVEDMTRMFYRCENLTSLDLSNFNTANVTDMNQMFRMCYNLISLDLSSFNTEKVTKMREMFSECSNLISLDLSSFNTAKVTEMYGMFKSCPKLTTIYCNNDWSSTTALSTNMFDGCTSLVGGKGTTYDEAFTDATYARPDGGTSQPGYFTSGDEPADYELYVAGVQVTSTNAKDILGDGGTFTFNAKTKTLTINGSYTYDDWFLIRNEVEDLTIYVANDAELQAGTPDFLFYLWKSTTITGPGKLTLNGNIAVVYGSLLTIKDANIEFPQTTSYAIMGNQEGEKLLISNSSIHAVSYYQAIGNFDGGITIENGMLEEGFRISDNGAYICKTDGGDANDVTIYDLEYITGVKALSDSPLKGEDIYNLAGQRLSKPAKGINIVGGKKIIRK